MPCDGVRHVENVHDTCIVQLDEYVQLHHKFSTSQCSYRTYIEPLCTVSSCTAQWPNDNWYESQFSRTDCKQKTNNIWGLLKSPSVLFICTMKLEILNQFNLQTSFASKWHISGHGFLIKTVSTRSPLQTLNVCNRIIYCLQSCKIADFRMRSLL